MGHGIQTEPSSPLSTASLTGRIGRPAGSRGNSTDQSVAALQSPPPPSPLCLVSICSVTCPAPAFRLLRALQCACRPPYAYPILGPFPIALRFGHWPVRTPAARALPVPLSALLQMTLIPDPPVPLLAFGTVTSCFPSTAKSKYLVCTYMVHTYTEARCVYLVVRAYDNLMEYRLWDPAWNLP